MANELKGISKRWKAGAGNDKDKKSEKENGKARIIWEMKMHIGTEYTSFLYIVHITLFHFVYYIFIFLIDVVFSFPHIFNFLIFLSQCSLLLFICTFLIFISGN